MTSPPITGADLMDDQGHRKAVARAIRGELNTVESIAKAALSQDFDDLERWLPRAKRGSNLQRVLDSLRNRLETIQTCAADGIKALAKADAILALSALPIQGGGWRPAPGLRDGSEIVFYSQRYGNTSAAVRWNVERGRFETRSGYSTSLNDDVAWSHWSPAPPVPSEALGSVTPSASPSVVSRVSESGPATPSEAVWLEHKGGPNPAPGQCVDLIWDFGVVVGQPSEKVNWSIKWSWRPSKASQHASDTREASKPKARATEPNPPKDRP